MIPNVPRPDDGSVRIPVDVKLKPGWRYEPRRRALISDSGEVASLSGKLPKGSRIAFKTPLLAKRPSSELSAPERELLRYLYVVPPAGQTPEELAATIRSWPGVEDARKGPEVSLP